MAQEVMGSALFTRLCERGRRHLNDPWIEREVGEELQSAKQALRLLILMAELSEILKKQTTFENSTQVRAMLF